MSENKENEVDNVDEKNEGDDRGWEIDLDTHILKSDGSLIWILEKRFKKDGTVSKFTPKYPHKVHGCLKYVAERRVEMGYDSDVEDLILIESLKDLAELFESTDRWVKENYEKYKGLVPETRKDMIS